MQLQIVSIPYRYDDQGQGLGAGPDALLAAGIEQRVSNCGHAVTGVVTSNLADEDRIPGKTAVNIGRLGAATAGHVAAGLEGGASSLVLAGDDTGSIGVVAGLQHAYGAGARIGVIWLDAHGDFNTPETSFSGILAGMPLAIIAGLAGPNWREAAGMDTPVATDRILLAGVRELDEKEETLLRSTAVRIVTTTDLRAGELYAESLALLADRCDVLVLHLDLDLLDPHLVPSATTPAQHGLELAEAAPLIRLALATGKVDAFIVCNLNPGGGQRGQISIDSALKLLDRTLPYWTKQQKASSK